MNNAVRILHECHQPKTPQCINLIRPITPTPQRCYYHDPAGKVLVILKSEPRNFENARDPIIQP